MLRSEMLGKFYNKVDHCKKLVSRLNLRIEHEIELMYQNISAALIELGLPSISRYKPLYNYQKELVPAVIREFLQQNSESIQFFLQDTLTVHKPRMMHQLLEIMESAPKNSSLCCSHQMMQRSELALTTSSWKQEINSWEMSEKN